MPGKASKDFESRTALLRLPDTVTDPGIIAAWSLESIHRRVPVGFSFDEPATHRGAGYADPVLLHGEGHLITIAPTGAGKGVGCVVPALLRHDGPVIVIDPKGENFAITARARREMGQKVFVLDPMGITDQPTNSLNPLDLIYPRTATGVDDAAALARLLLPPLDDDRNRFWENRARQILSAAILHVVTDLPEDQRNLTKVREVIGSAASGSPVTIRRFNESIHPEVRSTAATLELSAPETVGSYMAYAQEGIDFIRGPQVQAATERSDFSLDDITRGDAVSIYVVIPPHMLTSHGRLLRLWIGTMMGAIVRRRARPPKSTLFLLDEAAQLGALDELRQAMTLLRGYGLQTWSFWQDVSQLHALYPRDWQTMVNNAKVVQCFGPNTMVAAEDMARLVGWPNSESLLDMQRDELILQIAGDAPVVAKLPNYRTDPAFSGRFDENPYYDPSRDPLGPPRTPLLEYMRPRVTIEDYLDTEDADEQKLQARPEPVFHQEQSRFCPHPRDVEFSREMLRWYRRQR